MTSLVSPPTQEGKRPINIAYLTYGDLLSNVFASQLFPLWEQIRQTYPLYVCSIQSPSILLRSELRGRLKAIRQQLAFSHVTPFLGSGYPPRFTRHLELYLARYFKKHPARIVHCRGPIASYLASRVKKNEGLKYRIIMDTRGDSLSELAYFFQDAFLGFQNYPRKLAAASATLKAMEQEAWLCADQHFCVSKPLAERMQNYYGPSRASIEIIPCWSEVAPSQKPLRRAELNLEASDFVWGYAGAASSWQGFELISQLFARLLDQKQLPRQRLLVLSADKAEVEIHLKRNHIPREAVCIRSVPHSEVVSYLTLCNANILARNASPVNSVASPMKFSTYLQAGRPILISPELGDCSQVIAQNNLGEVAASHVPEALFDAAMTMISMRDQYAQKSFMQGMSDFFQRHYTLGNYLPRYLEIYEKLAK